MCPFPRLGVAELTEFAPLRSQEFVTSVHSTTERIGYPLDVTRRLTELLRASSSVYPLGKRTWGDMEAGFLERI